MVRLVFCCSYSCNYDRTFLLVRERKWSGIKSMFNDRIILTSNSNVLPSMQCTCSNDKLSINCLTRSLTTTTWPRHVHISQYVPLSIHHLIRTTHLRFQVHAPYFHGRSLVATCTTTTSTSTYKSQEIHTNTKYQIPNTHSSTNQTKQKY